ncbi:hypothetical protein BLNAU_7088 [Blattamonas nauphoetae]|uniref:Protein kinase domain-containing protein n=1 Tax=Blattamonas nauphoetae TaxID=2049346 RepID=A0ABQ9Y2E4_9EUKA|nr:hypothetical protein BLNAU_7088 [Blattamonas nauphoetae]
MKELLLLVFGMPFLHTIGIIVSEAHQNKSHHQNRNEQIIEHIFLEKCPCSLRLGKKWTLFDLRLSSSVFVKMFDSETFQSGSSISLIGVTHHSETSTLPPLVGLIHPPTQLQSTRNLYLNEALQETEVGVTVVGMGLVFDSTSFPAGTGPLFSFGISDEHPLPEVMHSLTMETTLIGSELMNVTSRMVERKDSMLFWGEVTQRVFGSDIGQSSNHDSGTAMMDANLGGNLKCVNTSFWNCRREVNTEPSFINENITLQHPIGRQVISSSSTVTLVSYSLCTFNDMVVAAGGYGGAAIYILYAAASLSVKDCFFQKCQVIAPNDDGGAIHFRGNANTKQYFRLERSSFSKCKSIGTDSNYAGCAFLVSSPVTITDSFFENSSAQFDGALSLYTGTNSILFNCAFVLCSSRSYGGAVGLYYTATFEFSYVQFRRCSSTTSQSGRDVFFHVLTRTQVANNFTHCDSTSGLSNVYFFNGTTSDSTLIPQITSPPTISDISIQFDEVRLLATVSVTASEAIGGTMGILLDGSLVPRLVHVTFGTDSEPSQAGSAVVSSGPLGVLPKAEYEVLNHSFAAVFLAPRIIHCVFSLKDSNTSVMIVSGWELEKGDYVMTVEGPDGVEKEISLDWVNSWTLQGTLTLYASIPEGQLNWDTEYEVTNVLRRTTENEDIKIDLVRTFQFTTPKEPIRVEGTKCSLGGEKEKAGVVEFWGVGLSRGSEYTLKVQKESLSGELSGEVIELKGTLSSESESGSFLHSEEIFGALSPRLSFGATYLVVGIVVGVEDGVVNEDVRFSVPAEPSRVTKMTASSFTNTEKTEIEVSFETHALKGSTSYEMILQSIVGEGETGHEKTLVLTTNVDGEFPVLRVILYPMEEDETKRKGQLEFGTRYEVKRVLKGSTEIHISDPTFSTPIEPARIENCITAQLSKDRTALTIFLSGRLLTSPLVSICLSNGSLKWLPLPPITVENDTHCSVEFLVGKVEDASTLAYGHQYSLIQFGESTDFAVNSGIVVYVPNPPTIHEMKFSFANNFNTSCVVEVSGSDLVASTEYNVTLNSSLCIVIQFVSTSSGKSDEIQIGWEGGLNFETEYTVTSIVPLNDEDGDILLVGSVSGGAGKRPSSFNIFADSSSMEGSPFCGDLLRACSSMSEVWKIVSGLSIVRPTIEIVDSVRMTDGIRIVGGMHVVIRNGTSSEPSLIVPSSLSLDSLSGVIVLEASSFLEIRNVDVSIDSSDSSLVFVSATQATIILREGSITGPTILPPTRNEEDVEDVCSWTSGVLQLTECTTSISRQDFTHLSQGVVNMKGGSFKVEASLFRDNTPLNSSFHSLRRNVFCSDNGTINVGSMAEGDGYDGSSGWFSTFGCSVTGLAALVVSPFFTPSLSTSSTSSFNKKKELFEIETKGSTLIPCGLILEVFEMTKDKKEGISTRHSLNRDTTTSFTETSIKLSLPSSSLSSLKPDLEWRGRLMFGEDQRTDTTFMIQQSRMDKLSQSVKDNMKWWLPLVIVVAAALLALILLIVVCIWRRKKNVKKEDSAPLITAQEMEVEKFEVMDDDGDGQTAHVSSIRGLNGNTLNSIPWTEKGPNGSEKKEEENEEREIPFENRVYGLSCGEKSGNVLVVDKTETLYRRLHVLKVGVDREWARLSVARGLSHAMKMSAYSAILTELTSHSVVLSGERSMSLILKTDSPQSDPVTEHPTQTNQVVTEGKSDEETDTPLDLSVDSCETKPTLSHPVKIVRPHPLRQSEVHRDDVRWQAPEEDDEREGGSKKTERATRREIDRTKASVFRLGLVLWEIETGLVPFAEQDGVNAHRNMSIGIVPKMDGVGEKMKGLIEECLSVNPDARPSVDLIISRLSLMDGKASAEKAQQIALS